MRSRWRSRLKFERRHYRMAIDHWSLFGQFLPVDTAVKIGDNFPDHQGINTNTYKP